VIACSATSKEIKNSSGGISATRASPPAWSALQSTTNHRGLPASTLNSWLFHYTLFFFFFFFFLFALQTATLEAASARMAARDRFGAYAEPGQSPLQRAIRELNPITYIGNNKETQLLMIWGI
jgi:hypothetical protein